MAYRLENSKALLEQVARRLKSQKWFADGWRISVHYFPPAPAEPESVTLHMYKTGWFNEARQGIHFETQLGPKQVAERTVPVMLHILHTDTVPGTNLKRIKLSKPLVDDFYATVSRWDGYVFRAGKYGTQPFSVKLKFSPDTLVEQLSAELTRLCKELGPRIDRAISDLK